MRISKRSLEGYLLEDNRVSGGALQETPVVTCAHCQVQVRLNPGRVRDRARCAQCDKYICDFCDGIAQKTVGKCLNYQRQLDDIERQIRRNLR